MALVVLQRVLVKLAPSAAVPSYGSMSTPNQPPLPRGALWLRNVQPAWVSPDGPSAPVGVLPTALKPSKRPAPRAAGAARDTPRVR